MVLPVRLNNPLPLNVKTFSLPLKIFPVGAGGRPVVVVFAVGMAAVDAAVIWPWAFTVSTGTLVLEPYVPAVTPVFAMLMVPLFVIGPPVRPVPEATEVTVPPDPLLVVQSHVLVVLFQVNTWPLLQPRSKASLPPLTSRPETRLVVAVEVSAAALRLSARFTVRPRETVAPPLSGPAVFTVIALFASWLLAIPVGTTVAVEAAVSCPRLLTVN